MLWGSQQSSLSASWKLHPNPEFLDCLFWCWRKEEKERLCISSWYAFRNSNKDEIWAWDCDTSSETFWNFTLPTLLCSCMYSRLCSTMNSWGRISVADSMQLPTAPVVTAIWCKSVSGVTVCLCLPVVWEESTSQSVKGSLLHYFMWPCWSSYNLYQSLPYLMWKKKNFPVYWVRCFKSSLRYIYI